MSPLSLLHALALCLFTFIPYTLAQSQFLVPDGSVRDLSESWTVGETMEISWSKVWSGVGDASEAADLWITWFTSDSYSQLLLKDVRFDKAGSLNWKVNVSNAVVQTDPEFVLRLKPHSDPPVYTNNENESPSRGFNLLVGPESDPSSSAISSASSMSSSASSSTTTSPRPSNANAGQGNENNAEKKSNVGPIVGGVVGGIVFLALLALIAFLLRLAKKNKANGVRAAEVKGVEGQGPVYYKYDRVVGQGTVVEIEGRDAAVELEDGRANVHEMGTGGWRGH
ncbi:hypothetical protein K504DRAFT_533027 [Pleomassaria siparia CBS 279.74]|uniref:Mid2 domain-containing protein n=1 Tax=Pleomassaria siparia CBS 279.74 TaxID=1314801 RepID=A0A6G1KBV2_9PLEO|nr:hypothetical protein K504DRAFT_533027 [Pleomassaria siparia CBS 279.74]